MSAHPRCSRSVLDCGSPPPLSTADVAEGTGTMLRLSSIHHTQRKRQRTAAVQDLADLSALEFSGARSMLQMSANFPTPKI